MHTQPNTPNTHTQVLTNFERKQRVNMDFPRRFPTVLGRVKANAIPWQISQPA